MNRDDELRPDAEPLVDAGATGDGATKSGGDSDEFSGVEASDAWESIELVERSTFSLDELAVAVSPDGIFPDDQAADQSRVDGMPEGWLDPPTVTGNSAVGDIVASGTDDLADESGVSHSSRVEIGTGRSGITSASDAIPGLPAADSRLVRQASDDDADAPWHDESAEDPVGGDPASVRSDEKEADAIKSGDDWGDIVAEVPDDAPSESVGFGAFLGSVDTAEQALASDSFTGDSQGLGDTPGEAIDFSGGAAVGGPLVAAGAITPSASRPAKPGSGLGQLLGVVLGGVLAIPVTLAILLWGLGRDPFQLTRHMPESVAFLLPAKFQPGQRSGGRGTAVATPALATAGTLDQLPVADATGSGVTEVDTPATPAVAPDESASSMEPQTGAEEALPAAAAAPDEAAGAVTSPPDPPGSEEALLERLAESEVARLVEPDLSESLAVPEVSAPAAAPMPAIELAGLEGAIDRAVVAAERIDGPDRDGDPVARDQALVEWYRALSDVAGELANLERVSVEAGLPATAGHDRFAAFRRGLVGAPGTDPTAARLESIADLGAMWLASERRPAAGAIVIGSLESVHRVGPWWGGRLTLAGESPTAISFLSRNAPEGLAGDRVIATGVLADSSTMWMVDCSPLGDAGAVGPGLDESAPAPEGALPSDDGF